MTLEQLEEEAVNKTEALVGGWTENPTGLSRQLLKNYQNAYKVMDEKIKNIHTKYLSGVKPEDYYSEISKNNRLTKLEKETSTAYTTAARKAGTDQAEISKLSYTNIFYMNMFALNWFLFSKDKGYYKKINQSAMDVSVTGTSKTWKSISPQARKELSAFLPKHGSLPETLFANSRKDQIKLKQIIDQALRNGDSYTRTTNAVKDLLNTTANNAMRIVRTESARNMNAGAYNNTLNALSAGVDIKRLYLAVHDKRTRQQSASMDGQEVPPDKPFVYPNGATAYIVGNSGVARYDINDRCRAIDVLEGYPPEQRTGRSPFPDADGKYVSTTTSFRLFDDWMKFHGVKYNKSGRIV